MKKEYKIPTVELMHYNTALMLFPLDGSGTHGQGQAPAREPDLDLF